jgi:ribosomal protein S18 acetylase RimI-like enzyme
MDKFRIRPITNADVAQLMGMDHSSSTDHVWQLELRRDTRTPQVSAVFREVRLPRPVRLAYPNDPFALADEWKRKAKVWLAENESGAAGYLCINEPRAGLAWISDLAVAPAFRRKGVASSLVKTAHAWCAERQNRSVFIEMQSKNYPAISMAQKNAYEFCGYNDRYYSNQDIMLVFVRAL